MFCSHCGKETTESQKFCTNCGAAFSNSVKSSERKHNSFTEVLSNLNTSRVVQILVILAIIGFGIYASRDDEVITKNNNAITSFESGNSQQAIQQFQQAAQDASSKENRINTLKNLGYVYASEGEENKALVTFREALPLAEQNSYDYYLISGEIALLEGKPNAALLSFNKAYQISPNEFQVNNSLGLFYLDLDEVAPQLADYQKALTYAQRAYDISKLEIAKQNLAVAHYFNENYNQTISLLSTTNFSNHPYMALWLGLAYMQKEDVVNAKTYFRMAINAGVEAPQEVYEYLASH